MEDIRLDSPGNFANQPYQATWMAGEFNITVRGEVRDLVVTDLMTMVNKVRNQVSNVETVVAAQPTMAKANGEAVKQCPQCGSNMLFKQGQSKTTGKPYKGYFCESKPCSYKEWLS